MLLSNPKILVFFGALIPQFMDMNRDHVSQVALLGVTFMVIAGITDGFYALLAGRARLFFSARRTRAVVAPVRRLHDRRRRLAGVDAGALA